MIYDSWSYPTKAREGFYMDKTHVQGRVKRVLIGGV